MVDDFPSLCVFMVDDFASVISTKYIRFILCYTPPSLKPIYIFICVYHIYIYGLYSVTIPYPSNCIHTHTHITIYTLFYDVDAHYRQSEYDNI